MGEGEKITGRKKVKDGGGQINVPATTVIFLANYFGVTTDYLLGQEKKDG